MRTSPLLDAGQLLHGYAAVGAESADVANLSLTGLQRRFTDLMSVHGSCGVAFYLRIASTSAAARVC